MKKRKILLIGWDAADWKVINPLLDAGKMPALEKLVNRGVIGNLATLNPPLSPMLWTSIATGKRADKHGILGFVEPHPGGEGIRAVNVTTRKTRALWNIFQSTGLKSNVISWWPSHPAEPINGVMVSNFFKRVKSKDGKLLKLPKGAVYPESYTRNIADLRVLPGELTAEHIIPFIPNAAKIDQEKDKRLAVLASTIAETATVHAVATHVMADTEWDFMAIYLDGIDHFCHGFMKFHPPKLKAVPQEMFDIYKDVVNSAYMFHDMMLERLIKLAGEDTTIILISDHGFHSDSRRPLEVPKVAAGPAWEHNPYGVICMAGPGIKKDERIYGATLLDITPTILTLYDLPVGQDMDGKILTDAFEKPKPIKTIESWDLIKGDFGTHPEHMQEDTFASIEALEQLVELGYIEEIGEDKKEAVEKAKKEWQFDLAQVYVSYQNYDKAVEILVELVEKDDKDIRFALELAKCYLELHQFGKTRELIDHLRKIEDKFKPSIEFLEGVLLLHENKPELALEKLKTIEKINFRKPKYHIELGKIYNRLKRHKLAEESFQRAILIDNENPSAHQGLAVAYINQEKYEEAADNALTSIAFRYHSPFAHFYLGRALYELNRYKEAANAFEICLHMSPNIKKARIELVHIYNNHLNIPEKADKHQKILDQDMKGEIIIVSGLPRSGTSMMMQMLHAGGLEILTDENREADENNPKGYYEFEAVKKMAANTDFLTEATGKAVKVIVPLLKNLPPDFNYKVIFMQRDINEIMISQQKMLGRDPKTFPQAIAKAFEKEQERVKIWAEKNPFIEMLEVNYKDIIKHPRENVAVINKFLSLSLKQDEMIKAIEPKLYRNKLM